MYVYTRDVLNLCYIVYIFIIYIYIYYKHAFNKLFY